MAFRKLIACALLATSACATSEDPSDGGFASGVTGVTQGGYEQRLQDRQDDVDQLQAAGQALAAQREALDLREQQAQDEIKRLETELRSLKAEIVRQSRELEQKAIPVSATVRERISITMSAEPTPTALDEDRISSLSKAISDAKALVESLAELGA